jgi:hypothetical protein
MLRASIVDPLTASNGAGWRRIAEMNLHTVFADDPEARKRDYKSIADTYSFENLSEVCPNALSSSLIDNLCIQLMDEPKCAECGQLAAHRCSRCAVLFADHLLLYYRLRSCIYSFI